MIRIAARGITVDFDPSMGLIERVEIEEAGRRIAPFHTAPWVESDENLPADTPPHLARLGGDFFCAPFAASEDGSPMHGWPANSAWRTECGSHHLTAVLDPPVSKARLSKEIRLRDGHPFVYQRHLFDGGEGEVSFANHGNISVPDGALISTSRKRAWQTPPTPQEGDPARGRSLLRYPARTEDPRHFPSTNGEVDLTRFPWGPRHEDFVMGLEADASGLGWTAVVRIGKGDVYLSLRSPTEAPMTMLWHSNGGRDYAPWSGRHYGCLGVEEGAAGHMLPEGVHVDLCADGALRLADGKTVSVDHVTGAIAWPTEERVIDVAVEAGELVVCGDKAERRVPFDETFLKATR